MVYTHDSKSCAQKACGFESHLQHSIFFSLFSRLELGTIGFMQRIELDSQPNEENHGGAPDGTNARLLQYDGLRCKKVNGDIEEIFKIFEEDNGGCGDGLCADTQYFKFFKGYPQIIIAIHVRPDESMGPRFHISGGELNSLEGDAQIEAAVNLIYGRLDALGFATQNERLLQ